MLYQILQTHMSEQKTISTNDAKARWLQRIADGLSLTRALAGPAFAAYIAKSREYRTVPTVVAIGVIATTDYLDGKLARKAKAYRAAERSSEQGAWLDQMADKVFVHGLMGGMAIHAARKGDKTQAGILFANQAVQFARDTWVTGIRSKAQEHDIPTGARWLGKVKTATTLTALAVKALPTTPRYESSQTWTAIAGVTAGTALSVVSGVTLAYELQEQIKSSSKAELLEFSKEQEPMPAVRIVLDDTNQVL